MFVTVFTATLVHILCSGIYGHFTTFYMAFAAAFTATLVCIYSLAVFTATLVSLLIFRGGIYCRISIVPLEKI